MYLALCCLLCSTITCVELGAAQNARENTSATPERGRIYINSSSGDEANGERNSQEEVAHHTGAANEECDVSLDDLYFLYYNESTQKEKEMLKHDWPCEVRKYWNSASIQRLEFVVRFLFDYASVFLVTTGLVANIYSLFVLNSPPINNSNMSVYLKALAISDIGALIFNIGVGVLRAKNSWISNIYTNNKWMCFFHKIFMSVFFHYSTWLIVVFTFERLLIIKNPFKIHSWKNEKPAKLTIGVLAVITLGLASFRSVTTPGFENDNMYGYLPCKAHEHFKISINMVPFIIINNIIPTILITSGNICLLILVRRSAKEKSSLNATDDQTNSEKVTRVVIIISAVYLILILPVAISGCIELIFRKNKPPHDANKSLHIEWAKKMLLLRLIRGFCFFLYLLSFVNNFFLYCLSGDIFRQTVKVCLPYYLQKICPCKITKEAAGNFQQRIFHQTSLTSQRTTRSTSTTTTRSTHTVSETGCNNTAFSHDEESNTQF